MSFKNSNLTKLAVKFAMLMVFCFMQMLAFAQNAPKTWMVKNPPYSGRNHASLIIDRVELTPTYTIVGFIFDNRGGEANLISICNSFKIMANHKKVASIIKTVGIPLTDVSRGFHCAELPDAMTVRAGQVVKFDLYFTPIPKDVEFISLIEYNTTQACEYDVFDVDIRQKKKTSPNKIQELPNNQPVAGTKNPFKVIPPPSIPPTKKETPKVTKKEEPKIIAKKEEKKQSNEDKAKKEAERKARENNPPEIVEVPPVKKEEPKVSIKNKELTVKMRTVDIEIWDNDKEDGDIISLKLNGKWVLQNREVKKVPYKMSLSLGEGENILIMQAENLGTRGNNTAAIKVNDGVTPPQTVVLNSDMGKSEAIKINVE